VAGTIGQGWTEKYARQGRGRFLRITRGGSRHWQDWNSRFTFAEKCNPPQVAQCEWSEWQLKEGGGKV